ncbi:hypothetical protein [Sporomusa malonica]|uniref:Uncharacterized protein n=1 Tax=Sporomusa malonica TaxID=112901 RepID=A0A1W2BGY4_9FIRM|nr:hypothetical protein [Sporomusa malonica]SMC72187.1 hypothetical protein SAMN04488500_107174 [Sporomusa malonica]
MDNDNETKLEQERILAKYNANNQIGLALITMGQNALKSATLINGGAAITLLAFVGNIWDKGIDHETAVFLAKSSSRQ